MTEDEAKAKISEAKLKWIRTDWVKDSNEPKGVIGQSISAKSYVDKNSEITITINEYEEMKRGTININVASLIGYTKKYEKVTETVTDPKTGEEKEVEKEVEVPAEKVNLVVTVNDEQVESKEVSEDSTNVSVGFDGKGTVTIKVKIDGSTKATKDLNLNSETAITIE